jgi:hypothetical protein
VCGLSGSLILNAASGTSAGLQALIGLHLVVPAPGEDDEGRGHRHDSGYYAVVFQ